MIPVVLACLGAGVGQRVGCTELKTLLKFLVHQQQVLESIQSSTEKRCEFSGMNNVNLGVGLSPS